MIQSWQDEEDDPPPTPPQWSFRFSVVSNEEEEEDEPPPTPPLPQCMKGNGTGKGCSFGQSWSRSKHHICVLIVLLESIIYTKILLQEYNKKR